MLLVAALGVAMSNLAFLLMAHNPGKLWAFYAALSADNLFQGSPAPCWWPSCRR